MGQGFLAANLDLLPDIPIAVQVITIERAQRADGLIESAGLEFTIDLEMGQEGEDLGLAQAWDLGCGVVGGELTDPAEVGCLRAFTQPFELDKTSVVLVPFGRGEVLR